MKKIKILRIIARLNIGGPAIHAILLTEGLDRTRFETVLICGTISRDEGDMLYYAQEKNIKPYFIPEFKRELNFVNDIVAFIKIYHIIRRERPDIIHTHTAKAGALGRLAAICYNFFIPPCKKSRIVHTFHGHIFSGYFNNLQTKAFIFIERILSLFTDKIIIVSESLKNDLISLGICQNNKIQVINLGLELDKFLSIPVRGNPILNIGIVGRLAPIKNHRLFLDAAEKVIRAIPGIRLRFKIIGDGELRSELEEYTKKLNINTDVVFSGWQKESSSIYSELDILALTSLNEGTPVSLIEAMASGRAVVATDVGGVKDLLGAEIDMGIRPQANFKILKRGIIVKPNDSYSFAEALILLLENEELRKAITQAARLFVKENFKKERLITDIENLYNSLLSCN